MGLALINIKSAFCSFKQEGSDIEKGQALRISAAMMVCVQHLGKPTPKSMSVKSEFKWVELRRLKSSGDS